MTPRTDRGGAPVPAEPLLSARDLRKIYPVGSRGRVLHAVDGVSFDIAPGETLALVGESGCGKTTAARCAIRLEAPDEGTVTFDGEDLARARGRRLKRIRARIQMVFQDPFSSLNPRLPVSAILAEPLVVHDLGNRAKRRARVADLLQQVGLSPADGDRYPHEFSGGQRQRIAIARALALDPDLIVADEPLSALDVSVQSQIINLLLDLRDKRGLSYLFISHDLAVVEFLADRVAVMYLGRIVESGPREEIFRDPRHPYTRGLLEAVPRFGRERSSTGATAAGEPPDPTDPPEGCPFHPRCPIARDRCRQEAPPLEAVHHLKGQRTRAGMAHHLAACHFRDERPEDLRLADDLPEPVS